MARMQRHLFRAQQMTLPLSRCYIFVLLQLLFASSIYLDHRLTGPVIQRGEIYSGNQDSLNSLISKLPAVLRHGYEANNSIFPYFDSAIANKFTRFRPEFDMRDVNATFMLDVTNKSHFYYYSGNLMQDQFTLLRSATNITKHVHSLIRDREILSKLTANVWIGKAGVQATAHYDSVHNVYLHLAGIKVNRLLPPSAVKYLQVHGRMHPYACQSRYKHISTGELFNRSFCVLSEICNSAISELNDQRTNEYSSQYNRDVLEVTLLPGDVLYIPPFWFHEIVAQTASLSVSLWWDAAQLDVMDEIYALPLPLESYWGVGFTVKATEVFLSELCAAVQFQVVDFQPPGGVDIEALTSLIKYRYIEDWQHQYQDLLEVNRGYSGHMHMMKRSIGEEVYSKLRNAAQRTASIFVMGFMAEDNFASDALLRQYKSLYRFEDRCEGMSDVQCIMSNQIAILHIKLVDYIEDVFLQVSELILAKECKVDAFANICVSYSGYLPMELSAKLLLEWIRSESQ